MQIVMDHDSRSRQHFLAIFQTALLWHSIITYNKIQYNTKTDEKISKVDLLQSQFIRSSTKTHPPHKEEMYNVYAIFILQSWEMRKTADNTAENILIIFSRGANKCFKIVKLYGHLYI
jgi:hypothetical protein